MPPEQLGHTRGPNRRMPGTLTASAAPGPGFPPSIRSISASWAQSASAWPSWSTGSVPTPRSFSCGSWPPCLSPWAWNRWCAGWKAGNTPPCRHPGVRLGAGRAVVGFFATLIPTIVEQVTELVGRPRSGSATSSIRSSSAPWTASSEYATASTRNSTSSSITPRPWAGSSAAWWGSAPPWPTASSAP